MSVSGPYQLPLSELIGDTSHITSEKSTVEVKGLKVVAWRYKSNKHNLSKPPVIALHGGPAFTHNYLIPLKILADHGHDVIFYDQAGCGESTHVKNVDVEAPWLLTIPYYLEELQAVISHYHLKEYYVFGSSWGTVIAQEWGVTQPKGLYGLILDGALSDPQLYIQTQWRDRLGTLPLYTQQLLLKLVAEEKYDHPAFGELDDTLGKMFTCRLIPRPDCYYKCLEQFDRDIYVKMQGPCEFSIAGVLNKWKITDRLHLIQVPTIVLAGEFDTMTAECSNAIVNSISTCWPLVTIPRVAHCKLIDEPQTCVEIIAKFLRTVEAARHLTKNDK